MKSWKYLLIVATLLVSILIRAATYADRNLPVFAVVTSSSQFVSDSSTAQVASLGEDVIAVHHRESRDSSRSHTPPRPAPLSKILIVREITSSHTFIHLTPNASGIIATPISYIRATPSRPPSFV